jgi:hypothetical protein
MLAASQSTLTDLALDMSVEEDVTVRFVPTEFWLMRFPRLRSLRVSYWHSLDFDEKPEFESFLIAHVRTLARFGFSHIHYRNNSVAFTLSESGQGELQFRFLEASDEFFDLMINTHLERIRHSLRCFSILLQPELETDFESECSTLEEEEFRVISRLSQFLDHLTHGDMPQPLLTGLTEICLPFNNHVGHWHGLPKAYIRNMERCATVLGSTIELISGALPAVHGLTVDELGSILGRFKKLKTVHISIAAMGGTMACARENAIRLGSYCPLLENILVVKSENPSVSLKLSRGYFDGDTIRCRVIDECVVELDRSSRRNIADVPQPPSAESYFD